MIHKMKQFFQEVQSADQKTKTRWLIVLSGGTMFIILILWVAYFNIVTPRLDGDIAQAPAPAKERTDIGAAISDIKNRFVAGFVILKRQLGTRNTIDISNAERNFILEDVEKIPPTQLP